MQLKNPDRAFYAAICAKLLLIANMGNVCMWIISDEKIFFWIMIFVFVLAIILSTLFFYYIYKTIEEEKIQAKQKKDSETNSDNKRL